MVCELTPTKQRVKVAVTGKERPILVEITNLQLAVPQVSSGLKFTISGRLNEKDRTGISNAEQLTPVILHNGGKVFNRDITKVLDANWLKSWLKSGRKCFEVKFHQHHQKLIK